MDSKKDSTMTDSNSGKRTARKSTAPAASVQELPKPLTAVTRRQSALVNKRNNLTTDKFLENFDPESSARERRKLHKKVNAVVSVSRKVPGALYDENGVHISSGLNVCDCLNKSCPGCYFPCPKCKSLKCGPECRCNRKFIYEQIEYHGYDRVIHNPFANK